MEKTVYTLIKTHLNIICIMKTIYYLSTCVLAAALLLSGCKSKNETPFEPVIGEYVPDFLKSENSAAEYGFIDVTEGSKKLIYGFEEDYVSATWQYKPLSSYSDYKVFANYDRNIAFDTDPYATFSFIDNFSIITSSPDNYRIWDIYGYLYNSSSLGMLVIPAESSTEARTEVNFELYTKTNSGGNDNNNGNNNSDNSWEKKIEALYHYAGSDFAVGNKKDFSRNVTVEYDAKRDKYYLYESFFHPGLNGGRGLRFDAKKGYNSVEVYAQALRDSYGIYHTYLVFCRFTITD